MVEVTVSRQLRLIENQELLTKKVTENPILTDRFITYIHFIAHMKIDRLAMFYFFTGISDSELGTIILRLFRGTISFS